MMQSTLTVILGHIRASIFLLSSEDQAINSKNPAELPLKKGNTVFFALTPAFCGISRASSQPSNKILTVFLSIHIDKRRLTGLLHQAASTWCIHMLARARAISTESCNTLLFNIDQPIE